MLVLALCASVSGAAAAAPSTPPAGSTPVAVVELKGTIDDYSYEQFVKRFEKARASGAKVIVVNLNTYGGLVTAGLDTSRFLKSQTDVRTVAFVGDKAISAGAMIALACDEIVMAPYALLGDCAPILSGGETLGGTEREKVETPIRADFTASALRNGYDPLLATSMVTLGLTVHWVEDATMTKRRFVDQAEFDRLSKDGWTHVVEPGVGNPVDGPNTLLTVDGRTAVKLGLAKAEFATLDALVAARNYQVVANLTPTWGDAAVSILGSPAARSLLIVLLFLALYTAMHTPGHGLPEAVALIALGLLVGIPLLNGYAQWWEVGLIVAGIVLLAVEMFVLPGFGVAGIAGIVALLVGLVLTFVGGDAPGGVGKSVNWWAGLQTGLVSVVSAMGLTIVGAFFLSRYLPKVPLFGRLVLTNVAGDVERTGPLPGAPAVDHGPFWPAVGAFGDAVSELRPGGSVAFYDPTIADVRVMSVISATGYVARGTKITVLDNKDNRILVRPQEG